MSRANQQVGKNGQRQVASMLAGMGLLMVEEIGNPYEIIRKMSNGHFEVIFSGVASGDHNARLPDGSFVLVETKTVLDGNLTYSHLREHQPERLSRHAAIGWAVSLLCWVHSNGIYIMQWGADGIEGFEPRKSITPERAGRLHDDCVAMLQDRIMKGITK
jgi:hypothetical protein